MLDATRDSDGVDWSRPLARPSPRYPCHREALSEAPIRYHVSAHHPGAHLWRVHVEIHEADPEAQQLSFPAWIPGSYLMREFAKNLSTLRAEDDSGSLPLERIDRNHWVARGVRGVLRLTYEVYAWDLSVRTSHLDQTHGFFNGTALFVAAKGLESRRHQVTLSPPTDPLCTGWQVATTLPRTQGPEWGFGTFQAADYDELIDHPVEMGCFDRFSFDARGVCHDVVLTGRHQTDIERLRIDLRKICEAELDFFGEPAPMERYLFLVMIVGNGYGGLEHRNSTSLIVKRSDLPAEGELKLSDGYRNFMGLCSHEYFHLWNVKRIMPAAFQPFDLTREAHTTLLWAFEGITSYYDDLFLLRAGLISVQDYLELIGQNFTRVYRGKGRLKQSLSDSSFDAWTKFYRQDESAPNSIVSYYKKGALVALALDLEIRRATEGERSLDDVMQRLWSEHGEPGIGVPEDGVERIASEVAGTDLSPFFDRAIRGTEDLEFVDLLAHFGVRLHFRRADSHNDGGGKRGKLDDVQLQARGALGARLKSVSGGVQLTHVLDDGSAQDAGLSAGDVVVAMNGLKVTIANINRRLKIWPTGTQVRVHFFRRDELMERTMVLRQPPLDTAWLELVTDPDEATRSRRVAWFGAPE
jgi:predicted metalloprotease with PDZ domain